LSEIKVAIQQQPAVFKAIRFSEKQLWSREGVLHFTR